MQVLWAKEALDRLSEIEAFISNDSPQRAVDFTNFITIVRLNFKVVLFSSV